ncbi:MAG: sulfate adenylyltransferase, partial [Actinomycetota bacterium]|nr:sulfate adenylyltransferase [Actinomycetota bacterium]
VQAVDTAASELAAASAGHSIAVRLTDDLDVARGDVIADAQRPPRVTSELNATLCWLADTPLRSGARLLLKHGTRTTQAVVTALHDRLDTDTLQHAATEHLEINDIGRVAVRAADPLPVDDYVDSRTTGSFLLIDPPSGNTLAAGLIGAPQLLLDPPSDPPPILGP